MNHFQIHCVCACCNEADVIGYTLDRASLWADRIYVIDNGSTDGTWDIVNAMAGDKIVPFRQTEEPFSDAIRRHAYVAHCNTMRDGDWWCRLDADEEYIDNPREFLGSVPRPYHVVWGLAIDYYITEEDLRVIDFSLPFAERATAYRHYRAEHSEQRFVRYRPRLEWKPDASWPSHMGLSWHKRILFRHFKYRSPEQIATRMLTRAAALAKGKSTFPHWKLTDWHDKIASAGRVQIDMGDNNFVIDETNLPDLRGSWKRRLIQRCMHGLMIWP
ncbi:MAG: glycosyltransferase family 2 protein [Planctomycetes bacterium]|nr:glycosyltransferase family 2 protein [Planctomycetota bacterium]